MSVAAEGRDAWYLLSNGAASRVGHVTAEGMRDEAPTGPAPVVVATGPNGPYLLEGVPDDQPASVIPRTSVLEALDPARLGVLRSAPLSGLPTDLVVSGGRVWVASTGGAIAAFDAATLAPTWSGKVDGRGPGVLAAGAGSIWLVNGLANESTFLIHRLDPASGEETGTFRVPGSGSEAVIAVGERVWLATPGDNGNGSLYPVSLDGMVGAPLSTRRLAGMTTADGALWWITTDGDVARLDEDTLARSMPVRLGDTGEDIAIGDGRVWAASKHLVELRPRP